MNELTYTISQASELVGKKSYVLRYWEDELSIPIARNEMGHRYYTGYDIQLFLNIRELQRRGLQLRAIKDLIPKLYYQEPGSNDSPIRLLPDGTNSTAKPESKPYISKEDIAQAAEPLQGLDEYKMQEFQAILEKLISQGMQDQKAQDRESKIRTLDATIRSHQRSRREAAAAAVPDAVKKKLTLKSRKKKS